MKRILFVFLTITTLLACKNKAGEPTEVQPAKETYTVFEYRVQGLNDSIIADSIWKMIFKVEGIDEMVIDKENSLVKVKLLTENANPDKILEEIVLRGGKEVKRIN